MIANSASPDRQNNKELVLVRAKAKETNTAWLTRIAQMMGNEGGGLLLVGGNSMADFRIRVAQAHLRHDLTPSYWSIVGLTSDLKDLYTVPLQWTKELSEMPHANGIDKITTSDFDDPIRFPNIAFIRFSSSVDSIVKYADRFKMQRNLVDLPSLVVAWLGYVWAVGIGQNPLTMGQGVPSAVFVESIFGIGGIELTPGLATQSSCPEAIWQAAKWWAGFYKEVSKVESSALVRGQVPKGCFALQQPAAAIYEPPFRPSRSRGTKP